MNAKWRTVTNTTTVVILAAAVALYLCYRTYLYNSAVGHTYGAPLPPEAPYPIHQPQNKSGCQISVAVQLLARHLEVNCQYKMFA